MVDICRGRGGFLVWVTKRLVEWRGKVVGDV